MEMEQGGTASLDEKLAPATFVEDVRWSVRALLDQPGVALISIGVWCLWTVSAASPRHSLLMTPFLVAPFAAGWDGAERLFFLHRRQGWPTTLRALLSSVRTFAGRFIALGCLIGFPVSLIALGIIYSALTGRISLPADFAQGALFRVGCVLLTVAMDLVLTFVPSALVYTTRSATKALRIGVAMIRQTWPRSGLYVLCPALALNMLNAIYPTRIVAVRLLTTVGFSLLALIAKGATASFYLRERPISPDSSPDSTPQIA
jgi:hypothetical protein